MGVYGNQSKLLIAIHYFGQRNLLTFLESSGSQETPFAPTQSKLHSLLEFHGISLIREQTISHSDLNFNLQIH